MISADRIATAAAVIATIAATVAALSMALRVNCAGVNAPGCVGA